MGLQALSFRIESFDRSRLERIAKKRGKPATAIVRELTQKYIDSFEEAERKSAA
ncbi:MAG: hypothetical protein KME07_06495 [Pegethrix bostrychoides GSE-TBD4-15B]|jgi:predicted DNA-binding protein|uniref:Uncharacterized protein n=1 Tax=Pegethrix bostrychoides GSE-TBD4-15B TaxID=2839662 RepID=A0A951U3W0_9CYAN|nr:hypothetical protein [Pegethrix bostrychoides GSE-TBD4-15B]